MFYQIMILCLTGQLNIWINYNEKITGLCGERAIACILFTQGCTDSTKPVAFDSRTKIRADRLPWHGWEYVCCRPGWRTSEKADRRCRHSRESDRPRAL